MGENSFRYSIPLLSLSLFSRGRKAYLQDFILSLFRVARVGRRPIRVFKFTLVVVVSFVSRPYNLSTRNYHVDIKTEEEDGANIFYIRNIVSLSFLFLFFFPFLFLSLFQISQRTSPFERGIAKKHGQGPSGPRSVGTPSDGPRQEGARDPSSDQRLCESRGFESNRPRENGGYRILAVSFDCIVSVNQRF